MGQMLVMRLHEIAEALKAQEQDTKWPGSEFP